MGNWNKKLKGKDWGFWMKRAPKSVLRKWTSKPGKKGEFARKVLDWEKKGRIIRKQIEKKPKTYGSRVNRNLRRILD